MDIKTNNKSLSEFKLITVLLLLINLIRKIIVIPLIIVQLSVNSMFFIIISVLFGIDKANKYMDNTVINWIELFQKD